MLRIVSCPATNQPGSLSGTNTALGNHQPQPQRAIFTTMAVVTLRLCALLTPVLLPAALLRVEVSERSPILDGKSFGKAGAYERIIGKAHFAVDPMAAANRDVVNLKLAPRNAKGQ